MIIGITGHIDHGKTALVGALTGVATDRLPEEKRRGISIELGYAYLHPADLPSLGFVDMPGHERLLHTMLAGATGIAHAVLVIAADDGVMAQTHEHLAVVALLAIPEATVVISKIDRLDPAIRAQRIAALEQNIRALLAPTALAQSPIFALSAHSGEGVDALRDHLYALAAAQAAQADQGVSAGQGPRAGQAFRMAVDRSFTLAGTGTVVSGLVTSGQVSVGDELHIAPAIAKTASVRVRALHLHNRPATQAQAGQRCALAIAGVDKDKIGRGHWLCDGAIALQTVRIDVLCQVWGAEAQALTSGQTVHVHLGSGDVLATLVILSAVQIEPGCSASAQLVLRRPMAAWQGDRGVLRDACAQRTLAGIVVLDPLAPQRWRNTPERLAQLAARALPDPAQALAALLAHSPLGLDTVQYARSQALASAQALPLPADCLHIPPDEAIAPAALATLQAQALEGLAQFHQRHPDELGPDSRRLRRLAAPRASDALWQYLITDLLQRRALARQGQWLHLPEHGQQWDEVQQRLCEQLMPLLDAGAFDPPWVRTLAQQTGIGEVLVRQTLAGLARRGQLFQVVKDLYFSPASVARLAQIARQCADPQGRLSASGFRDATGLGRKRAIQILEFFDRQGLTRRVQDHHLLRPGSALWEDEAVN